MKVIQINSVYKKGSTGKITYDCHRYYIEHGVDSKVIYGRGETISDIRVYKACSEIYSKLNNLWSRFTGVMYGGLYLSTKKIISYIEKEQPDIVHLQCINGYFVNIYKLVDFLKKEHIKTILTLHAEFMYTGNCGHAFGCEGWKNGCGHCISSKKITKSFFLDNTAKSWSLMKMAFDGFGDGIVVVSVSPWLQIRAMASPILSPFKHVTILNGVDTTIFRYVDSHLRQELAIASNRKVVFFAVPEFSIDPSHNKGGYFLMQLANAMENVCFVVAGPYNIDLVVPENVIMLGHVENQSTLAKCYSMSDLTLILSRRETFSMICAESLCCGTPVAGFKAGGPEMIAISEYSSWVNYGDMEELKVCVREVLERKFDKKKICSDARQKFDSTVMASSYLQLYKRFAE